ALESHSPNAIIQWNGVVLAWRWCLPWLLLLLLLWGSLLKILPLLLWSLLIVLPLRLLWSWRILEGGDLLINGDTLCSRNRRRLPTLKLRLKEDGQGGLPDLGLDNLSPIV